LELSPLDQSENDQNQDGPQDRSDETGRLALSIPAEVLSDVRRHKGTGNAENNGEDKSSRISSRHEQLGDGPNHKTDHNRPYEIHATSLKRFLLDQPLFQSQSRLLCSSRHFLCGAFLHSLHEFFPFIQSAPSSFFPSATHYFSPRLSGDDTVDLG
jgi:hypothetical protein